MKKKPATYQTLRLELDEILEGLQRDDLDVDKAITEYERGLAVVQELQDLLIAAENRIKKVNL